MIDRTQLTTSLRLAFGVQRLAFFLALPLIAAEPVQVPKDLARFVEPKTHLIEVERADLNRDHRSDALLILENDAVSSADEDSHRRILIIALQRDDGSYRLAARAEKAIGDDRCGGVFGDCLVGVSAKSGEFTIQHYGGSSWRWAEDATFRWSRIDQTWELVRVVSTTFHTSAPDEQKKKVKTPPRDFGKIKIEEFDPWNYEKIEN